MDNNYKYLFPFEKVPKGANIIIYGAGILGQEYLKQIKITDYCKVIGFVDKNFAEYKSSAVPVYAPEKVNELEFDFVVVALRSEIYLSDVKRILNEQGVIDDKIVCVLERVLPLSILNAEKNDDNLPQLACDTKKISFAIYMSGGIGDMVIYKRIIEELHRILSNAILDIFAIGNMDFLQWVYCEEDYIKNILHDLGNRYNNNREKYSIAISLMGASFLQVDYVNENDLSENKNFLKTINKLIKGCNFENFNFGTPVAVMFYRRMFNGENCYTGFNYGDVFSIKDIQIKIPSPKKYIEQFEKIGLQNYITINTGNGTNKDSTGVSKSWPIERFQKVADMFKKRYPNIKVVQIGLPGEPKIDNAYEYFIGESFGLVAEVLRNAIFHLDIEGGLVHLASQIGTKCIVLFGPTQHAYFAYDGNINIRVGDCHDCCGLYLNIYHCARHMSEPECMYSITPEIVMNHIEEYMKEWENNVC